ncbi:MAG: sensor histidine kinase [Paracoccaceae bacterium]
MARVSTDSNFNALRVRIAILLSIAILPLGLIAVLQTQRAVDAAREAYRDALAAQTAKAAQPERDAIRSAFALADGLASVVSVIGITGVDCAAAMKQASDQIGTYSFIGVLNLEGRSECNNRDGAFDFWADLAPDEISDRIRRPSRDVVFNPAGSVSERPVMIVGVPAYTSEGSLLGFIAISFFASDLNNLRDAAQPDEGVALLTFNSDGELLTGGTASLEKPEWLPTDLDLTELVGRDTQLFSVVAENGVARDYALVPIVEDRAYALGTWRSALAVDYPMTSTILFPLTMWLITLAIAVWALGRQVVSPIRRLRMRMQSFADDRTFFPGNTLEVAPNELRGIGASFETMADKILRDEADLEDKVREREMLLREVHHRVKNNLQLMSSIINMQIRQSEAPEAEAALKGVQGRLASLAKFHQDLYLTSSLSKLRADRLLRDLARQIFSIGSAEASGIDLQMDFDEIVLSPDQTSPLAMLATEALTNVLKYASADPGEPCFARIAFKLDDAQTDTVRLQIENSVAKDKNEMRSGLGSRLIAAFGSQLEASVERECDDGLHSLTVVFERAPFEPDDEGTATDPEALTA